MIDWFRAGVFTVATMTMLAGPAVAAPPDPAELSAKIDKRIAEAWKANDVTPAPPASDAEFLRRVTLDLAGRVPQVTEVRDFLADTSPNKRREKVRKLLE